MSTINKKAVRMLIAALRSGKYKQGRRGLFTNNLGHPIDVGNVLPGDSRIDSYCCLGVACVVAAKHDVISGYYKGILPPEVAEWFGFPGDHANPQLNDEEGAPSAASTRNDVYRWTFEQIADGFERTYVPEDVGTGSLTRLIRRRLGR